MRKAEWLQAVFVLADGASTWPTGLQTLPPHAAMPHTSTPVTRSAPPDSSHGASPAQVAASDRAQFQDTIACAAPDMDAILPL